jgi:hypothetical protein
MNKLTLQEFKEKVFAFTETLEPRRKSYLKEHFVGLVLFAVALIFAPLLSGLLADLLDDYFDADTAATMAELTCYIAIPLAPLWHALSAIKMYKNESKNIYEGGESLKNMIFNKTVGLLGNFQFSDMQDINPIHLKESYLVGDFKKFYSEDIIYGNYSGCMLRMGEVFISNDKSGKDFEGFSGMVISIDFSNPELILRQHFSGNTIVVIDEKKTQEKYQQRFAEFKKVDFNDSKLEELFEIFSTNVGEAKSFIRPQLFEIIEKLYRRINNTNNQVLHGDDRITGMIEKTSDFLTHSVAVGIARVLVWPFHFILGLITGTSKAEISVNKLPSTNFDKKNLRTKNRDKNIELAFFEDKLMIKMPYDKNLFQPNSIYQKPIIEEDLEIIYDLIESVKMITEYTVEMRAI